MTSTVAAALVHAILVGYYLNTSWKVGLSVVYSAALVWLLAWVRIVAPLRRYRRPWRVVRVQPERDSTWTLVVASDGHPGFTFMPGQYAWITVNRSPFTITSHPFSFPSSTERAPGELLLSIKERGDFTRTVRDVPPGSRRPGDRRPCTLILTSAAVDTIPFREDFEELERGLDLKGGRSRRTAHRNARGRP